METKYVRVPFSIELAKEITNGTKDGRIVTEHGREVRIVYFSDFKTNVFFILCVMSIENGGECSFWAQENGASEDGIGDLMLEIPEYMTFKDGDVIAFERENTYIGLFKSYFDCNKSHSDYVTLTHKNKLFFDDDDWNCNNARFATEEEKQQLISALKQSEDPRAKECLKKLGIEEDPKCNFKPFDKVLVRNSDDMQWGARFFDRMFEGDYACTDSLCYKQCIPFNEKTEKLIGTTKSYNLK